METLPGPLDMTSRRFFTDSLFLTRILSRNDIVNNISIAWTAPKLCSSEDLSIKFLELYCGNILSAVEHSLYHNIGSGFQALHTHINVQNTLCE